MARKRKRAMVPQDDLTAPKEPEKDPEEGFEKDAIVKAIEDDEDAIERSIEEAAIQESIDPGYAEVKSAPWEGPYRAQEGSVLDKDGARVAIAGLDHNRSSSGPGIAKLIADGLNRMRGKS